MRVVVIGDVGVADAMMHIGDEAMFDALIEELRARGVTGVVGVSGVPGETSHRYGIDAVARIGFIGARSAMDARLAAVDACASGERALPADDPTWAVIAAVADADAVVIAGGGNMASNWPLHIFERAAIAAIADRLGRPLVVSGQTLGPRLSAPDRMLLGRLLATARLVGVREHPSERLARELGVPTERLSAHTDDATFLGLHDAPSATASAPDRIVVSLSTHLGGLDREATVAGLACSLDELVDRTGATLVFHPHFASLDPAVTAGDDVLHDAVRARMTGPSENLPVGDPRAAARLARSAAMLVTSRYHPAVFAAPAGVPIAALTADEYTSVKLRGVTGWWDQRGVIDLEDAASSIGGEGLMRVWRTASSTRADAADRRPAIAREMSAWFDRVAETVAG